jgi:hypothetical protein
MKSKVEKIMSEMTQKEKRIFSIYKYCVRYLSEIRDQKEGEKNAR